MSSPGPLLRWILQSSVTFRVLVAAVAAALLIGGATQLPKMPVDVLPEFSPPMVEVQTEALGLSAAEVEQLITVPLEADLLSGVAFLDEIRSQSVPGLSSVELLFEPGTNILDARQVVAERLTQAHALPNVSKPPAMIQPLSSTSRVMMIGLSSDDLSLIEQSVLAQWKIKPYLMGVAGVANIAIWGQRELQLQVQVDPQRLQANGVSLSQIIETTGNSLWVSPLSFVEASTPGTGGFIDTPNQRLTVQHISPITTPADLAQVTIQDTEGRVLRLGDVADVVEDHQQLIGDALLDDGNSLILVVEKFPGASTTAVTSAVDDALIQLAPGLPGLQVDSTLYRPGDFIESATRNVGLALVIGLALLALLLIAYLRDWRAALVSFVTIPLSLAVAAGVLFVRGATFNAMLLAGLVVALAVLVDDAVVGAHRIQQRLLMRREGASKVSAILGAMTEIRGALVAPALILLLITVPVFVPTGLTSEFSRPLVLSYALAVVASTAVAMLVTPGLALLLLRDRPPQRRGWGFERAASRRYGTGLARFIRSPARILAAVGVAVVVGALTAPQLSGSELLPPSQERDLLIQWDGPPGTSQTEMARVTARASDELRALSGVSTVGAHVGRAITSDEVVGVNSGEIWVTLDASADHGDTVAAVREVVAGYPGLFREVQTYPEERLRAAETGSDRDLVVRVYGQDLDTLKAQAENVNQALASIDGVSNPTVALDDEEPTLEVEVDLAAAQQQGINPGDVRRAAAVLLGGLEAGSLFEEQKVFGVVVWGTPEIRHSLSSVEDLLVDRPGGGQVRLGDVADVRIAANPSVIRREAVSRMVDVVADVRGRARADVVADVTAAVRNLEFPLEYHAAVLADTSAQPFRPQGPISLAIAALIGVLLLLQVAVGSWRLAALVLVSLPLALVGGGLALLVDGGPPTLPALAGLLAVFGIAVRTSVVLVRHLERLRVDQGGQLSAELVVAGARERLAPIVFSALGTALLLSPVLVMGNVAGLEVVRPAAMVVLGGLVTSTLYSLFLVPVIYQRVATNESSPLPQPEIPSSRPDDRDGNEPVREGEFVEAH